MTSGTTTLAYDDANQLVSAGATTFDYDRNGNLTRAGADDLAYDQGPSVWQSLPDSVWLRLDTGYQCLQS